MTRRHTLIAASFLLLTPLCVAAQVKPDSTKTQIVFLGTGTPFPDPKKSGPAVAIVVHGSAYLVDAGTGIVRRAMQASQSGIPALRPRNLRIVFITHLHSDHTLGLPDLMNTPWVQKRPVPLEVYGPPGVAAMVSHLAAAYAEDADIRTNGLERESAAASKTNAHEVTNGVVYKDANVTVTAFPVLHGSWKYALGYRFQTADRTIVVAGDTRPSEAVVSACNGCDVLIHESYTEQGYAASDTAWKKYLRSFHTSATELAGIASRAKPKLLILYHQMYFAKDDTDAAMLAELRKGYTGRVASARDLDIF
jgi:Metal-dependent hydrolases of the beta-lactamase superfamily III